MTERSGLDILEELLAEIQSLHKKVDVLDQNIKRIANSAKVAELLTSVAEKPKAEPPPKKFAFEAAAPPGKNKIMVQGKMITNIDGKAVPLIQVDVKIFDTKDVLIKTTKTNKGGYWMSQLSPGKYVVSFEGEYKGKKLVPINKTIEVPVKLPEGKDHIEVA